MQELVAKEGKMQQELANGQISVEKYNAYQQELEQTKQKSEELKQTLKGLEAQFKDGHISDEGYRSFQRELVKTEQSLKKLEEQQTLTTAAIGEISDPVANAKNNLQSLDETLKETSKTSEVFKTKLATFSDSIKTGLGAVANVSKTAFSAVSTAILGAGTAIAGAGIYSVKFADEYNSALNSVQQKTGILSDGINGFDTTLKNVFSAGYGESFQDVADAMSTVSQQTKLSGQELENTTQNALSLKETFGFEVSESIRSVQMLMTQFGISSEEAFNLIVQGAQAGL